MNGQEKALFDLIVRTALAGERMPTARELKNAGHSSSPATLERLTDAGHIAREISGHNWRVVEILTGEYAGKRTAGPGRGRKPYLIIDQNGRRRVNRQGSERAKPIRRRRISKSIPAQPPVPSPRPATVKKTGSDPLLEALRREHPEREMG